MDFLKKYSFKDELISKLSNTNLILLVLCCCGYTNHSIASTLGVTESRVHPLKLNLKHELLAVGYSHEYVESIIFPVMTNE